MPIRAIFARRGTDCVLFFLIVFIAVTVHLDRGNAQPGASDSIPLNANGVAGSGAVVDPTDMPLGSLELTTDISALSIEGSTLRMCSTTSESSMRMPASREPACFLCD